MTVNLLAQIPFFADLPLAELDRLASELEVVNLRSGEILFNEGDPGEHLYIVVNGALEILMAPGTSNELILNILQPGEYLGEMSLIQPGGHRTASARARGDAVLLSMSRTQFKDLLKRHPYLANAMVRVLSQRLDNTNIATFRDLTEKNRQLQKAYDELKAAQEQLIEKERMEKELQVAASIQMSILPDVLPSTERFDFGGRILPARQVGGDFYDVFELGDDKIGVLIGDVADKGVPSAIFMARVHALIIAETDKNLTPGDVLRMVNSHITRFEKSTQFVTALFGILDVGTGEFRYARAGHEPPLLLDPNGEVHRLPYQPGMALGLWEKIVLDEHSLTLPSGSCLLMFTDGMTDCRNPKGEPFGLERIKHTLAHLKENTAQKGCDQLLETLINYQGGAKQDDDVTLVAIHAK
ncbi:MAG: PP2C family protein-serine/threonine phosphatase [Chloroflexota bacterium]|nr:SpoIIE family protein phosphatase [Chloroflexota bacterium]MBI5702009.1 SpoIIE family protein phosphatase [Chloroflexota bacterium]